MHSPRKDLTSCRFLGLGHFCTASIFSFCTSTPAVMFAEISAWKVKLSNCGCVLAGDFNSDLDGRSAESEDINKFLADNNLIRCDLQHPSTIAYTFVNEAMTHKGKLDFITCDNVAVRQYEIIESKLIYRIIYLSLQFVTAVLNLAASIARLKSDKELVPHLRYYNTTMHYLQCILRYSDIRGKQGC